MTNYNRREFFRKSAFAAAGTAVAPFIGCSRNKFRPNVIWLVAEDISPDIGCYGDTVVSTPNLDRFAGQGTRFDSAFASCPVCSPVRSGMITGMYQTSIDCHQHRTRLKHLLPAPVRPVTDYFREAGYFTANVTSAAPGVRGSGKNDFNFLVDQPYDGTDWNQRDTGQPFFAQVNFTLTHRDFVRDPERPVNPYNVEIPPYYPDHPITRRDWANYLESLQVLDRQIGAVLQRITDEGLSDNTIVVFFGDHGSPHVRAKQWLYDGGIRIPLIIRWPGRIDEGEVSGFLASTIDIAPTSLALSGVAPPEHMQGQVIIGRSADKPRETVFAARDRCDGTVDRIRCARTRRYKLIRNFYPERPYTQFNSYKKDQYPVLTLLNVLNMQGGLTPGQARFMSEHRPEFELYDLERDPHETYNLADDPEYAVIRKQLIGEIDHWIQDTGDMGAIPEDAQEIEYQEQAMLDEYRQRMTAKGLSPDISDEDYLDWWEQRLFG